MFSDSKLFIIFFETFFSIFFFKFSFYNLKIFFETVFKIFIFDFLVFIFDFLFYKILNSNSKTSLLDPKPYDLD